MKKFTAVVAGAILTMAMASIACANESKLFPTDVLKQSQFAGTVGYEFQYGAKQNDYDGGHYDYTATAHKAKINAQVGLGYGLEAGVAWNLIPSARVVNDNYSTFPGEKGVYEYSGGMNPTFSLKYSPAELLGLSKDIGMTLGYSYTPANWGAKKLGHDVDVHQVTAFGSLETGKFKSFLGYEGEFPNAKEFREPNIHAAVVGTEYDFSESLTLSADLKGGFIGGSVEAAAHKALNLDLGVQYALTHNIWAVPTYGLHWTERHGATDQTIGAEMRNVWGLAIRTVF